MRKKHRVEGDEAEVDMTPMLDIVFIMLIFFIVTTSFTRETTVEISRPVKNKNQIVDPKNKNIFITIGELNGIKMNGRAVDINAIGANVETHKAIFPKASVIVAANDSSDADVLISIVDAARNAGVKRVSVIPARKK